MGYHVRTVESSVCIPANNQPEVYMIWCKLNHPENDHLKRGGRYHGDVVEESWYSWMDPHYDKKCRTVGDILRQLGFTYDVGDGGDIYVIGYDKKIGQERLFFERIKGLYTGEFLWENEDGCQYTWNFDDE